MSHDVLNSASPHALSADASIGALVTQNPDLASVFERFQLDYCCGGARTLGQACAARGVDLAHVIDAARAHLSHAPVSLETDWTQAPLRALTAHIIERHHGYLREVFPRITALSQRAAQRHGPQLPAFSTLAQVFEALRMEMEMHSAKEERVLFPLIDALEAKQKPGAMPVAMPIRAMVAEHDDAGEALRRLRALSNDYTPGAEACNTVRALFDSLRSLERDLHLHIHKENNILFPRAIVLEAQLRGDAPPKPTSSCGCGCKHD
jgi:regulator of cell morphogenesis and NO signaling